MIKTRGMTRRVSLYTPLVTQGKTRLPQNLLDDAGSLIEGFEDFTEWTVTGTAEDNTSQVKQGDQSIKLTSQVAGTGVMTKIVSLDLSAASSCIRVAMYLHGDPTIKSVVIYLTSVANFAKHFKFTATLNKPNAWHYFSIFPADWTNVGGEDWANTMVRLRYSIPATPAGEQTSISIDGMQGGMVQRPAAQICWSDSRDNSFTLGFPYAAQRNFRMTWFVTTGSVDGVNMVTWSQLQGLSGKGHVIGSHTKTHVDLSTLGTQQDMQDAIAAAVADLENNGLSKHASYFLGPGGTYNETVRAALEGEGTTLAYMGDYTGFLRMPLPLADTLTPRFYFLNDLKTLAEATAEVDAAITRMEVITFLLDGLVDGAATGVLWALADYYDLVDYILDTAELPIITAKDLIDLASGPIAIPRAR